MDGEGFRLLREIYVELQFKLYSNEKNHVLVIKILELFKIEIILGS